MKFRVMTSIGLCAFMGLAVGCQSRKAPEKEQAPGEAQVAAVKSVLPCAIETRSLNEEEDFKTALVLEETGKREYVAKMDSNEDGTWDVCIKTRWEGLDVIHGEVDNGCDGEVDFKIDYTRDSELNLVSGIVNDDSEMTLIVSGAKDGYFSEHTAYPLFGPRTNYQFESDARGRVTELHNHGQITHFTYNDSDQFLKIHGEDGTIVEYEYDGAGNIEFARWLKRDLLVKIVYDCPQ